MAKDFTEQAKEFILRKTNQKTLLKAFNSLDQMTFGDEMFSKLVAEAMSEAYEEGKKVGAAYAAKKTRKKGDEVDESGTS